MAKKKKKKKGSNNSRINLSPENYIKSRARALPISECYITDEWKESGMADILVARKHVNGHRTCAIFLVDLQCLGIKDASYLFNMGEYEFEDMVSEIQEKKGVKCEYKLVHNIIYGALEYAEDYGFSPHKAWEVAQYVLEEDDEHIPFMEIGFGGEDGNPLYVSGPFEDKVQQDKILGTLDRTAGKGNYNFILSDEGNPGFEGEADEEADQSFDDNFESDFGDELEWEAGDDLEEEDSAFAPGDLADIAAGKKQPTLRQGLRLLASFYVASHPDDELVSVGSLCREMDIDIEDHSEFSLGEGTDIEPLHELMFDILTREEEKKEKIEKLNHFLDQYGDTPIVLTLLFAIRVSKDEVFPGDIVKIMEEKYPDYLRFRFLHAKALIDSEELKKGWTLLGEKLSLDEAFPERDHQFTMPEFIMFLVGMCSYFTATGELGKAINYGAMAIEIEENDPFVMEAVENLNEALFHAIEGEKDRDNSGSE